MSKPSRDGEYLYLVWDSYGKPVPLYVRGHVSQEVAQSAIDHEVGAEMRIVSTAFVYMRMVFAGEGAVDGCTHEAREYPNPSQGAFKVTRCKVRNINTPAPTGEKANP